MALTDQEHQLVKYYKAQEARKGLMINLNGSLMEQGVKPTVSCSVPNGSLSALRQPFFFFLSAIITVSEGGAQIRLWYNL